MIRKYVLPVAALALFVFAVLHVTIARQPAPKTSPPIEPARSPFGETLAGSGVIEARTENIAVGSALPGVVVEVFVNVGQRVKAGTPLFRLSDRQMRAELKVREAMVASARAQLQRLLDQPRREELPVREALVREAEAEAADRRDQLQRARSLFPQRAISEEELVRRQKSSEAADAQLGRIRADLDLLKAGAWSADIDVARAALALAESQVAQMQDELDRLTVRALVDGEVLQVNVRPGEFVAAPSGEPLVMLGDLQRLHVRVDVDEHDIPRYVPGSPARAMLKGRPDLSFPLSFVRVEPFVIPKKSLTGENTERVDTRVLPVIYAVDDAARRLYVGQQVDVFIDAGEAGSDGPSE